MRQTFKSIEDAPFAPSTPVHHKLLCLRMRLERSIVCISSCWSAARPFRMPRSLEGLSACQMPVRPYSIGSPAGNHLKRLALLLNACVLHHSISYDVMHQDPDWTHSILLGTWCKTSRPSLPHLWPETNYLRPGSAPQGEFSLSQRWLIRMCVG